MGLFSRSNSNDDSNYGSYESQKAASDCRDVAQRAADNSRQHATDAGSGTYRGISADGWNERASTFQAEADHFQNQIDNNR